ncbi:antibiotic biosynthesis monooxygenase [Rhodophyticola sp.]|jgi:antibiotic biosynthesis monooxygenase (ABM) superfamily enzyme|uniref:antibiotic biosynthesis monooxygenase n=1 Tax=Rhodophyticola sp. TaxID=2680032 RepID=UPI003D28E7DA
MSDPVTVVARRHLKPGSEAIYEDWLSRLTDAAATLPGYLGAEFHRPDIPDAPYTSVFRFDTPDNLAAFEASGLRARFLAEIAPHVQGDAVWDRLTGLEIWFEAPKGAPLPQPNALRMALVLVAVVFLLVLALNLALAPVIGGWPLAPRLLLTVILQVFLMTYVIMPRVTKALGAWIYSTR